MIRKSHTILICIVILIEISLVKYSNGYFHLYETLNMVQKQDIHYYDCFYASVFSTVRNIELLLRPYCIRPNDDDDLDSIRLINESQILDKRFTFSQLRQLHITSENLYEWSAPIHAIEHYQLYLTNSSVENGIYYNCSSPFWFGSFCQYTLNSLDSFSEIIIKRFQSRNVDDFFDKNLDILNIANRTCYIHLECYRGPSPMCLDWREICNKRCDCLNNCIDEENCSKLEINECNQDEYRCKNGMCIPQNLFRDRYTFIDCMDASDETYDTVDERAMCYYTPNFDCDTFTCSGFDLFSCGDGQCVMGYPPYSMRMCKNKRDLLYSQTLFTYDNTTEYSKECWLAMICATNLNIYLDNINCARVKSVQLECPSIFSFPSSSILFNDIRFIFEPNNTRPIIPSYICYKADWCDRFLQATFFINGLACTYLYEFPFFNIEDLIDDMFIERVELFYTEIELFFKHWCSSPGSIIINDDNCPHSTLFHCKGTSKCISKYRLLDRQIDCYQSYDELFNESCSFNLSHRFYCLSDGKCISQAQLDDGKNDCSGNEDELIVNRACVLNKQCDNEKIIFTKICDGFTEMSPILIDNQNETDETNCEYWPCDTQYTHCDNVWNCYNGADELNCSNSNRLYSYKCADNEHNCIQIDNIQEGLNDDEHISYTCLPMKLAGNKQVDCIGSTDERDYCRLNYPNELNRRYRCWNDTTCIDTTRLCDCMHDCPFSDDEKVCPWFLNGIETCSPDEYMCKDGELLARSMLCEIDHCSEKSDALICDLSEWGKPKRKYFSIENNFIQYSGILIKNDEQLSTTMKTLLNKRKNEEENNNLLLQWYCNQGVLVNSFNKKMFCFCSPPYYGNRCQYQNEFIGLILNIRRKSSRDYLFVFRTIIILLDNTKNFLFKEQILYISPCEKRYQMYLLYPNRLKIKNQTYSIRLDIYSIHRLHNTIQFRTSFYHTIPFTFLPVHRFVVNLAIPEKQIQTKLCENIQCQNGKCYKYENLNEYYCRCDYGWYGEFCHLRQQCDCSSQSICTETGCICPLGKSGLLCYVPEILSCKDILCQHGGICIPHDQRILEKDSQCVCSEDFEGQFCEKRRMRIIIHFNDVSIPPSIIIHYLISKTSRHPDHLTQFKRISVYENIVILYPSMQYNMAFVQFDDNYYLILLDSIPVSADISTTVIPSNRCPYIEELFDHDIFLFHPLKRIKYYHLICQHNHQLRCFYDQTQLCLCTKTNSIDCFDFNHNGTSSCDENNSCDNNGKCYVNDLTCPTKSICVCKQCYYGTLCQFTTSGTILSLDSIIGYHIQPHLFFLKQSFIIKLITGITILMVLVGIIGNLLSIMTFLRKKTREVGCGIYLLSSSILSFLTIIIFAFKYWSLLVTQMGLITNEIFLNINCKMNDFLLRFLLTTIEWLNACVAIERVLNITMNINFNKAKSKYWAKFIIIIIILMNIISSIHDPLNRRLLEDIEEERIWCIVSYTYSSWLNIYNTTINIIHFIVPFGINFTSDFVIIILAARKRSIIHKNQTYRKHLREQFQKHKHLLISSSILVLLALPRLVISFFSGCMKSSRDPWLFLAAYFISFIPPILTFIIFVLPSQTYRNEFDLSLKHYLVTIRRCFRIE